MGRDQLVYARFWLSTHAGRAQQLLNHSKYLHHAAPEVRFWTAGPDPTPTPNPSIAALGDGGELHVAACAAPPCTHDRSLGFPS